MSQRDAKIPCKTLSSQDFPIDLLLGISSWLPIRSALSFTSTCRRLYQLTTTKTFWLSLLHLAREVSSIAYPPGDLISLDVKALKDIALHTVRRDENMGSPEPMYFPESVAAFETGIRVNASSHVPGTRLLVLFNASDGKASCWETVSGKQVCVSGYVGKTILDWSSKKQYENKMLQAFFVANSAGAQIHELGTTAGFSEFNFCDLDSQSLVLLSYRLTIDIVIVDYTRGTRCVVHTDIPANDDAYQLEPSIRGEDLCLFVHHTNWTYFHTIATIGIPEESDISLVQLAKNKKYAWPGPRTKLEYSYLMSCSYVSRAWATLHYVADRQEPLAQGVDFFYWDPARSGQTVPLASFSIEGYLIDNGDDILIDNTSSSCVLFFHEPREMETITLKLLTFDEETYTPTFHTPQTPKESIILNRARLYNILFDELLGVMYFVTRTGNILCVPYA
ncbi:hypothetical protein VNI00_001189 [Paramarasmius palmivorus]|uniref:F-box domain-containing protein n=1 Tax=Paramarasmius palmivorus TaxID=297713 RepID=A0AAW0E8J7_9AGAR